MTVLFYGEIKVIKVTHIKKRKSYTLVCKGSTQPKCHWSTDQGTMVLGSPVLSATANKNKNKNIQMAYLCVGILSSDLSGKWCWLLSHDRAGFTGSGFTTEWWQTMTVCVAAQVTGTAAIARQGDKKLLQPMLQHKQKPRIPPYRDFFHLKFARLG